MLPCLLVGLIGGLVAVKAHESDTAFIYRQQHPVQIEPLEVEAAVRKAPEPIPSGLGTRATGAHCVAGHVGEQRNPWTCRVRYASGHTLAYRIRIQPDGAFAGSDRSGQHAINGTLGRPTASPTG